MNIGFVSVAILGAVGLSFPAAQATLPTGTGPLRNTFVVAAETVIDNAVAVDIRADDAHFSAQMQTLKADKANLDRMAEDDREKEAASATDGLLFAVSACHIQARDGVDTSRCQAQIDGAQLRAMEALNKHKSNGSWVDGPPVHSSTGE